MTGSAANDVRAAAAPLCLSIKIVTGAVLLLTAGFFIVSVRMPGMLVAALLLALVDLAAYLTAPVAYRIENGFLTVERRWGEKTFGPVQGCSVTADRTCGLTLRLWGNGGMFAGTGIFWNRRWGLFRAYVTRAKQEELVLVETGSGKVLISPEDPAAFVRDAGGG